LNINLRLPTISVTSTVTNACNGNNGSIDLNVSGGTSPYTYNWTGSGSGGDPRTNLAAGTYNVTVTDNVGCTGTHSAMVTNITPTTANAGPDQTGSATCGATQVTLAANNPSVGTGMWSVFSGSGGSFGNASSPTSTFTGTAGSTYTLRWTISNSPCTASFDDVVVTFNRNPTAANAGPDQTGDATCGLTQVTLAANSPTVGTGMWSVFSGTGGSFGNASSPTSNFSGTAGSTYTLRWTISNSPCTASFDDVVVTFNRNPTAADAGPDQTGSATCGATQVTLAANSPTVGTGMWSVFSGTGGSFGNASSPTSNFSGTAGSTYTLRWTISNSPCTASFDDVVVTFNRNPTVANAGLDQTGSATCGATQVTLAANSPTVGTGMWSVFSGSGGSFSNASSPTSNFSGTAGSTYTLRWTISNSPCTASFDDVVVTFNRNPTAADAGPDQTGSATCGATQVTLAANSPTVGTGMWSVFSGSGGSFSNASSPTSNFSGTAGSTYTLRWTISNSPCTASFDDVVVTFNRNPTAADAGTDQTSSATCGATQVTLAANSPTVGTGMWSVFSGTGGSFGNAASPTSTFNGTAGSTYTLRWTISNSPCTASTDDVVVTFNRNPTAANAGPDQTGSATCGATQVTLAANSPTVGTGMWSVFSGTGGSFGNASSPTSTFNGTAGSTYTLRWTISSSPCTASTDDVVITFNTNPVVTCPLNMSVEDIDPAFALSGAGPAGGTYSGPGVSGGIFDPSVAGLGMHTIQYAYTSPAGCSGSCTFTIAVTPSCTVYTWYLDADNDGYYTGTGITQCESPGAGYRYTGILGGNDCNDNNAAINPDATEICDGIDNNCNGMIDEGVQTTFYRDMDGDGFGDPANTTMACSVPMGYVTNNTDCDDNDPLEKPGQVWYADLDNDGYSSGTTLTQCLRPAGYKVPAELTATTGDCNDNNAAINPAATEICDGIDNNCNGQTDEGVQTTFYRDMDGDGFGDPANTTMACLLPNGYVTNNTDCDDNDPLEKPGQVWYADLDNDGYSSGTTLTQCLRPAGYKVPAELTATTGDCNDNNAAIRPGATEICDGIDNNCNGMIDEGVQTTFYRDMDGDGFGDPANTTMACSVPMGYVTNNTDCDDNDPLEKPGQVWYADLDNDGYSSGTTLTQCLRPAGYKVPAELTATTGDCNDNNAAINPAATEICDGIDNNCNGMTDEGVTFTTYYRDMDNDGFGDPMDSQSTCDGPPTGYVANDDDCDDTNDALNPNTVWFLDADNDNYYTGTGITQCESPGAGYRYTGILGGNDCNDNNAAINPDATEICDGIDNNCNGMIDEGVQTTFYRDMDGDGFGDPANTTMACSVPMGYVTNNTDCDDNDPLEKPGQVWYADLDNDGYSSGATLTQCLRPAGYKVPAELTATTGDCNDNNAAINPAATEICDGIDNNCNGMTDEGVQTTFYRDMDGDGFGDPANTTMACSVPMGYVTNNTDCDDNDPLEKPGQVWYADLDNDGYSSGATLTQCLRPAGYKVPAELTATTGDCNDNNAAIRPGATEICDGIDNNCNGSTDEGNVCCPTGNVIYVNVNATGANNGSSWADALTDLLSAINTTCPGITEVWVAAGTYYPTTTGDRGISFRLRNGRAVYGGFNGTETMLSQRNWVANPTILSGDIGIPGDNSDNSFHVVRNYSFLLNNSARLDGFTITGGNATGSASNTYGGGMFNFQSNPTIANCTFINNSGINGGGVANQNSAPTYLNCRFIQNTGTVRGGGMYNENADPMVINGSFTGNFSLNGGGLYASASSFPVITNSSFSGNRASGQGGAVISFTGSAVTLTNCVIWNNQVGASTTALGASVGIASVNASATISYSLIANSGGSGAGWQSGIGTDGGNNLDTDPMFVQNGDPATAPNTIGDLHLQPCSPAIDAGTATDAPATDIDGNARPALSGIDMGAYEFTGTITNRVSCYRDADGDGFGNPAIQAYFCVVCDAGFVSNDDDCDDTDDTLNPNTVWYLDADGDGYSNGTTLTQCLRPANYFLPGELISTTGDCNDNNAAINPGATEICDGIDNDCDGLIDVADPDLMSDPLEMSCPATQTLQLNSTCSATLPDYRSLANISGGCGTVTVTQMPAAGASVSQAGPMTVTIMAIDESGSTESCTFTVNKVDVTPPTAVCVDGSVSFNGESAIVLNADSWVDADDNCGVASITLSPAGISCEQLGQTVPVTVTVKDVNNLTSTCTSNIAVTGLPCGWSQNPDGVGCANGNNIAYNPGTGVWTATSSNCFYGPGFTSDATAFAQRTLCGDGSITAQVTGISGTALGWAGVLMRENNTAGAKKAQLMTNLSTLSRREFRTTTNGAANPQQFPSQDRYWLRIVRAGNQFSMYVSSNGLAWYFVGAQNVPMNSCIQVGLVATNYQQNSTVTATFANVSFAGSNVPPMAGASTPLSTLEPATNASTPLSTNNEQRSTDFQVYPNPTSGELNVNLEQYAGLAVRLEIYSLTGQLLRFVEIDEVQTTVERLDLSAFQNGMYLVKVKSDGLPDATKRVAVTR
jgi:regulation of enolase protein 1 (concanavalin A-like superfamily)